MKYLNDYMEQRQTELFNSTGSFFAFSNKQLDEAKKEGIVYVNMGLGLICPKDKSKILRDGLDTIYKESIAQDIAENGIIEIIKRELYNHEAFYTGEIDDTIDKLSGYNIDQQLIIDTYRSERHIANA